MINRKECSTDAQVDVVTRQLDPVVPEFQVLHASNARKGPKDSSPGQVMPQFTPKTNDKLLLRGLRCLAFLALFFCVGSAREVSEGTCRLVAAEASFDSAVDGATHNGTRRQLFSLTTKLRFANWLRKRKWGRTIIVWVVKRELTNLAEEHEGDIKLFKKEALKMFKRKTPEEWLALAKSDGEDILAELKELSEDIDSGAIETIEEAKKKAMEYFEEQGITDAEDFKKKYKSQVKSFAKAHGFKKKDVKKVFKKAKDLAEDKELINDVKKGILDALTGL